MIAISGTFEMKVPQVLADAFFEKGAYSPEKLLHKIKSLAGAGINPSPSQAGRARRCGCRAMAATLLSRV